MASCVPFEAPEGTEARPITPPSRCTSASTVGRPRESRISRETTRSIRRSRMRQRLADGPNELPRIFGWSEQKIAADAAHEYAVSVVRQVLDGRFAVDA